MFKPNNIPRGYSALPEKVCQALRETTNTFFEPSGLYKAPQDKVADIPAGYTQVSDLLSDTQKETIAEHDAKTEEGFKKFSAY